MRVRREVLLICDNCGDCTDPQQTAAEAVKAAREDGWECTRCPCHELAAS